MEPIHTRRSTLTFIVLAFLLVAVGLTLYLTSQRQEIRHKAAEGATLTLTPRASQVREGDEIIFDVALNTGDYDVATAQLAIIYNPTYLEGVRIDPAGVMPNVITSGVIANGKGTIAVRGDMSTPFHGQGNIATVTFRGKLATPTTTASFDSTTYVPNSSADPNQVTNVLVSTTAGTIQVIRAQDITADTTLSLVPATSTVEPGSDFTLTVEMNTGDNQVSTMDLVVNYDPSQITGLTIARSTFLPLLVSGGTISNGTARIVVGASSNPVQGSGTVAVLQLRAVGSGTTNVTISPQTNVRAFGSDANMVAARNDATVTISSTQTPSPTPTPAPTPTASPNPTETPGTGGGANPTPYDPTCHKTAPAAPTNLRGVKSGANAVSLTWDYSHSTSVTHYSLVYGMQSGKYIYGADNIGITNTYTVRQLNPSTTYYFAVRAFNDCAAAGYSNEISVLGSTIINMGNPSVAPKPVASPKSTKPGATPTPLPGFKTVTEVPFLSGKPKVTASPSTVSPLPEVSVPPVTQGKTGFWSYLTPIFGILLIIAAIITGIYFFRMRNT